MSGADTALIRQKDSSTARVDIVGLKGGASYDFKIVDSDGKTKEETNQTVTAYDRSGYAHFGYTDGVGAYSGDGIGAYNNDGTLKSGANVVYVTEKTKNTVTATIGGTTYTGIVKILQNAGTETPLDVRIIGQISAATWNEIDYNSNSTYNSSNKLPASNVVKSGDKSSIQLPTDANSLTQAALISGGYNTLNTTTYTVLDNLTSKATYKDNAYDSYWNMCDISGVKNVTVEGIGEDATIFQWGFTWKNCNSIEVRNLTFDDYIEDACSFEGGSSNTSATDMFAFTYGRYWVHNNTVNEGKNYWDVSDEQDKHEGDGGIDVKRVSCVTIDYNEFVDCHKTGLVGSGSDVNTAAITFHHNYYNGCKSRMPLARQANIHMYNNYYYNSSGENTSLRAGAYALIENCVFENIGKQFNVKSSEGYGYAKVIGCYTCTTTNGNSSYTAMTSENITGTNATSGTSYTPSDYYKVVTSRTEVLTTFTAKYGTTSSGSTVTNQFDTDSTLFYYANNKSNVTTLNTAQEVKGVVTTYAGVHKHTNGTTIS